MINTPQYLKLSEICRMFNLNYQKAYNSRLELHEMKVLEMYFQAIETTTSDFLKGETK